MFSTYPAAHTFPVFPMMTPLSSESKDKSQLPFKAGVQLPLKPSSQVPAAQLPFKTAAGQAQVQFKMPGALEQFRMMQQLQQLQMIQLAMQQSLALNSAAAKSVQGWLSEPERVKSARDFVVLKRILFELSDEEHYIDIEAAEAALRERDPDVFTRTNKKTFQDLVIQANKVGVPISWMDETRSPTGKAVMRLTLSATHYAALVKLLMDLCTDDEPEGKLASIVAAQLRNADPGFWTRRNIAKNTQEQPMALRPKRLSFKQLVLEAQRLGAPFKWTGEAPHHSYVGLAW